MTEIEIFVLLDADGSWISHADRDQLHETWESEQEGQPVHPTRVLTLRVQVPTPAPVELNATVPADTLEPVPMTLTVA